MSTTTATKPLIQGPGLKAPGIVVMQFLFIALFTLIELVFRSGVGILTGVAICAALYGGLRFGRSGTTYVSVVTPPIAFAISLFALTLLFDGFKPVHLRHLHIQSDEIDVRLLKLSHRNFAIGSCPNNLNPLHPT